MPVKNLCRSIAFNGFFGTVMVDFPRHIGLNTSGQSRHVAAEEANPECLGHQTRQSLESRACGIRKEHEEFGAFDSGGE